MTRSDTVGSITSARKGFVALADGYERGIDFVLRHRFATLLTFIGTVIATGYLFVVIPKGLFRSRTPASFTERRIRAGCFLSSHVSLAAGSRADHDGRSGRR